MMDSIEWKLDQIDCWIENSTDYVEQALLCSIRQMLLQQVNRIEQQKAELDGRMWSPKEW